MSAVVMWGSADRGSCKTELAGMLRKNQNQNQNTKSELTAPVLGAALGKEVMA